MTDQQNFDNKSRKNIFFLLFLLLLFGIVQPISADSHRPKVAVVLSGGGAKGMAHIGALEVIERAGIPIDIVTGTSMGSIIGGLYSVGWSAQKLDSLVRGQNWPFLLSDKEDFYSQNLAGREHQNTYFYSKTFSMGKKPTLGVTGGIVSGKNLMKLFRQLTAGYTDSMDFSKLPIPFACVATNIVDNTEYDFHSGSLAEAMRASMSIPGFFTPIRKGDKVLVDGGLRNNYPADLAKAMGADIIIGVTVQGPPKTADDLSNGMGVIGQIVDMNCKNKYDENLAITDIPIRVDTKGYNAASFTENAIDTLIRRGQEAAMEQWGALIALHKRLMSTGDTIIHRPTLNPEADKPLDFTNKNKDSRPSRDLITTSVGARFDTEEMAALQVDGLYQMSKLPLSLDATFRLGKRFTTSLQAVWSPGRKLKIQLGYTYKYNDMDIYLSGNKDYNITYHHHQAALSLLGIGIRNLTLDVTARWDYYNYHNMLVSGQKMNEEPVVPTLHNDHYFSYHANLHYNSENDWIFPERGARFQADYGYFTDNFVKYNGHKGFSELTANWRISFPLTRRLAIRPMLYGRMLFGSEISYVRQNLIGGQWFRHYVEQQLPFVGIGHVEYTDRHIIALQVEAQEHLTTNNYILLRVVGAQHASEANDLLRYAPMLGYQVAYYYKTMFGPVGATLGYSNKTDHMNFFINFGYEF